MKKNITKEWLQMQIDKGRSSLDVANTLDMSKTSVLKAAQELGVKFKGKSHWRKT